MKRLSRTLPAATLVVGLGLLSACGGSSGGGTAASDASTVKGPIKIWLSNNTEELGWGKAMVASWNAAHPKEKITAQEIPAGKSSEEVIGAAITAGNAPCLIFNTSPAAVPQFQKQGGLVPLENFKGRRRLSQGAHRAPRSTSTSRADGKHYQIPWKSNPVMIFYNKDIMKKAGVDPANPPLATYDEFLATSRKIVKSGAAPCCDLPGADERVLPVLVRLLPAVRRRERRQAAGRGRQGDLRRPARASRSRSSGAPCTPRSSRRTRSTTVTRSPTARRPWRSSDRGPIAVYKGKVDWGVAPVPTSTGKSADQIQHLLRRQERRDLLLVQGTGHRLGRHEVRHQQGAGRQAARGDRPDAAAHRPADRLPGLLRQEPGLQAVRRAGGAHRRGAQRAQLHRDLAGLPRRVVEVGHLRRRLRSTRR